MVWSPGSNPIFLADYSASDRSVACSFWTFGTAGITTVDPAEMKFGDKSDNPDFLGRSMRRNTKIDKPYAQHVHPTIMKPKASE